MRDFEIWLLNVTGSDLFRSLGLFAIVLLVIMGLLSQVKPAPEHPEAPDDKPGIRALRLAGWGLIPLLAILFTASLWQIAALWTHPPDATAGLLAQRVHYLAIVGFIGVIGGLLGALVAYIRIFTTERQTSAQEQGLITDRLNKAVENLGATRSRRDTDGNEVHEPNLEVRIGAIYALERISQDSLRDHVQVMEILTAYIRMNAPASQAIPNPIERWEKAWAETEKALYRPHEHRAAALKAAGLRPGQVSSEYLRHWADDLPKPRTDIQVALTVIGRRGPRQKQQEQAAREYRNQSFAFDLRQTNLQAAHLANLDFSGCDFSRSQLEGANLVRANLSKARFDESRLDTCLMIGTQAEAAKFYESSLRASHCSGMRLSGAEFSRCRLDGTMASGAVLSGTADLPPADFYETSVNGTLLDRSDVSKRQIANTLGDASTMLPSHIPHPQHWPQDKLDWADFYHVFRNWIDTGQSMVVAENVADGD